MKSRSCFARVVLSATLFASTTLAGAAAVAAESMVVNSKDVKWAAAPPTLPPGAKVAVLHGNPSESGLYVMRLLIPAGYKIPLHLHSHDQRITVISGALFVGDTWEPKYAREVKAGGFLIHPAKAVKYMFTKKAATVIEIHSEGPFDVAYQNPEDDPQKWAQSKRYYFPSQYEEAERKAPNAVATPTF
ncbi:MAG TPA: cupin domain-containing protein [Casimicrobiaceae bacterium]|nr:cupin domain-containing protein [Casimicrobiaceae bacterium]